VAAPADDAFEAALEIARSFEAAQLPYAIGGALAYGEEDPRTQTWSRLVREFGPA
jgi:hypothetical protein